MRAANSHNFHFQLLCFLSPDGSAARRGWTQYSTSWIALSVKPREGLPIPLAGGVDRGSRAKPRLRAKPAPRSSGTTAVQVSNCLCLVLLSDPSRFRYVPSNNSVRRRPTCNGGINICIFVGIGPGLHRSARHSGAFVWFAPPLSCPR